MLNILWTKNKLKETDNSNCWFRVCFSQLIYIASFIFIWKNVVAKSKILVGRSHKKLWMIAIACKHARPVIRITVTSLIFLPLIASFSRKKRNKKREYQPNRNVWLRLLTSYHLSGNYGVTFPTMYWVSITAFEMLLGEKRAHFAVH